MPVRDISFQCETFHVSTILSPIAGPVNATISGQKIDFGT